MPRPCCRWSTGPMSWSTDRWPARAPPSRWKTIPSCRPGCWASCRRRRPEASSRGNRDAIMTYGSPPRMLVGLIGINIGQSLAPALHADAFAAAGMTGHYHLMDAEPPRLRSLPDLLAAARHAGFGGFNVTFPFKEAVIPLLDEVSAEAREIGAVNTVVIDAKGRTSGHNTDRSGFRAAFLESFGADAARGKPVLLLGAGGAGRAQQPHRVDRKST